MTSEEIEEKVFNSVIDFLKHVTTLSSGSILLLATFLEKLFHKPHLGFLVAISFVCFAVSIIGAFAEFFLLVGSEKPSGPELYIGPLGFCLLMTAGGGFIIGMLSLAIFGTVNFCWQ